MKVSIITLHRVFNYGSVLQAYATQRIFEELGYKAEIIDYITEQRTNKRLYLGIPKHISNNPIKVLAYIPAHSLSVILKKITFGSFLKRLNLTHEKYISYKDLKSNPPKADYYIAGSDQIWNSQYNEGVDGGFFLGFTNGMKISFASSFGKEKLDEWEIRKTKKYLSQFSAISVREDSAKQIVSQLGFSSECIIDPTLQISGKHWAKLASKRLIKDKYIILMLLYQEDNGATEYAAKLAKKMNAKLVKISWEIKKPKDVDILMTHRSPADFLSLFYYADYVVTNSFHGLAFSINFNKQFSIFPRNEFNSRIDSLLRLTDLQNRMVHNPKNVVIMPRINYSIVNGRLQEERNKARSFITHALGKQDSI